MKVSTASAGPTGRVALRAIDSSEAMAELIMGGYQTLAASVVNLGRVRESRAELARRIESLADTIAVSRSLSATIGCRKRGET